MAGDLVTGSAAAPPELLGDVPVEATFDLSQRSLLRVEVDGDAVDIDVAGPVAASTSLADVVTALDATLPGLASVTGDGRLRLTGPAGAAPPAVAPPRWRDLEECPPADTPSSTRPVTGHH